MVLMTERDNNVLVGTIALMIELKQRYVLWIKMMLITRISHFASRKGLVVDGRYLLLHLLHHSAVRPIIATSFQLFIAFIIYFRWHYQINTPWYHSLGVANDKQIICYKYTSCIPTRR